MSGGMRQRAMIALALACKPQLLLADEPTTALDATVQIQILLLRELQKEFGMAVIFVTHDVGVAVEVSDRVAVMYAGRFIETGSVRDIIRNPRHPYIQGLLAANVLPGMSDRAAGAARERIEAIPGSPPNMAKVPTGCGQCLASGALHSRLIRAACACVRAARLRCSNIHRRAHHSAGATPYGRRA